MHGLVATFLNRGQKERMSSETDFETELNAEVTKRLSAMEDPNYEFPTRMKRADWIIAGVIMAVCLAITEYATLTAGAI